MREVTFTSGHEKIKKVMLYECSDGIYVFGYDYLQDTYSISDYLPLGWCRFAIRSVWKIKSATKTQKHKITQNAQYIDLVIFCDFVSWWQILFSYLNQIFRTPLIGNRSVIPTLHIAPVMNQAKSTYQQF